MLVLDRKEGESLTIGDEVKITLVGFKRGKARIGIEAPKHIPVIRDNAGPARRTPEEFADAQSTVMADLATALANLSSGVKEPDKLYPSTHTTMYVRNSDLASAMEALRKFEEWART